MKKNHSLLFGVIAAFFLPAVYFSVVSILNSLDFAIVEFAKVWYWIILLSTGFGAQVGLFAFIRYTGKVRSKALTAEVAASGGISTGSMIACCAHYLVFALPFLGFSGAALFLAKYQISFFIIGIFSNLAGILLMLMHMEKHRLYSQDSVMAILSGIRLRPAVYILLGMAVIGSLSSFAFIDRKDNQVWETPAIVESPSGEIETIQTVGNSPTKTEMPKLESRIDSRNGINIEVYSEAFHIDEPIEFSIRFNTHQGDLDFKVDHISYLEDSSGKKYDPIQWEGDPPGGHHRSGKLLFPLLESKTDVIKLVLLNLYGIDERSFEWGLSQ